MADPKKKNKFPRVCKYCGEEKWEEEWAFQTHKNRNPSSFGRCKECVKARKNSPEIREINRKSMLKIMYGITSEEYNELLRVQNFSCAICKGHISKFKKALSVDHNHMTGEVRGLLCQKCNMALGLLGDRLEAIQNLLKYMEKYGSD